MQHQILSTSSQTSYLQKQWDISAIMKKALEKLGLFHRMETFWKHCRKRLENLISIVLSNSIVWKYILEELKLPYCERDTVFRMQNLWVYCISCFTSFTWLSGDSLCEHFSINTVQSSKAECRETTKCSSTSTTFT